MFELKLYGIQNIFNFTRTQNFKQNNDETLNAELNPYSPLHINIFYLSMKKKIGEYFIFICKAYF